MRLNSYSFSQIARSQIPNFCMSGANCFNDIDMLTVGMYGKGNVALGEACTDEEYQTQFALWCMLGAPLMMGGDVRSMKPFAERLLLHPGLIALNQDAEGRVPQTVYQGRVIHSENGWKEYPDAGLTLFKHLGNHEFAVGYFNFAPESGKIPFIFADAGLPATSGFALQFEDVMTGEELGVKHDFFNIMIPPHGCRVLKCRIVKG